MTDKGKIVVIKRYFEKKDSAINYFTEIEKGVPSKIRNNPSLFLEYLLENHITEYELEMLVDNAKIIYPMLNSELLVFIRDELYRQGLKVSGYQEGLFNLLVPNEVWEVHKKSWFGWFNPKTKAMNFRKTEIKQSIENTLNLNSSIWNEVEERQREIVTQKVKEFLANKETKPKNSNEVDLSSIIPTEPKISKKQQEVLEKLDTQSKSYVEKIVNQNIAFFSKKIENQDFLLQLLPILYKKSHFKILNEKLFPSLYRHHLDKMDVRIKEANTLTNLENPDYDNIVSILKSTEYSTVEESIDINTMIISNIKRKSINSQIENRDELKRLLWTIIEYYDKVYQKPYNYYPAINLVYTVKLFVAIFPNHQEANSYDLAKIYKSVKASIKADNKKGGDSKYYATMSDLEFRLLLGGRGVVADLYILLEELNPPTLLVEQTVNQMRWFLEVGGKFGQMDKYLVDEFLKVVEILEGYEGAK